jgi:hypothetical protein
MFILKTSVGRKISPIVVSHDGLLTKEASRMAVVDNIAHSLDLDKISK